MKNVILCGGSGTRLWPLSRAMFPKQFAKLFNERSLFQEAVKRNSTFCNSRIIVTNEEHYFLAKDQIDNLNLSNNQFLLEPVGRNTAPAIALACFSAEPDEIIFVTPSDHLITPDSNYSRIIKEAECFAQSNYLVTFGIKARNPDVGFGYIEAKGNEVVSFKEKPDQEKANEYFKSGNYYWNSGMFMFKASVFLDELKRYSSEVYELSFSAFKNARQEQPLRIKQEDMTQIPSISIDYAVMEASNNVKVVPSDLEWTDLGSFEALSEKMTTDTYGNTGSNSNIYTLNSKNNLIIGNERTIAMIDVEDLIVADSSDALLISKKGSSQQVRSIVEKLKSENSDLVNKHLTTHRSWGYSTVLEQSDVYLIKKVVVKPGEKLSNQKHAHRNEHWVILSGSAKIQINDKEILLETNQSTFISAGEYHRLENPGETDLVLIEVQVGMYISEDDIIRIN